MTLPQMPRTPKCLDEQPGASPFRVWPSDLSAHYPTPQPPPTHTQKLLGFFVGQDAELRVWGMTPEKDLCHSLSQNIPLGSVQKSNRIRVIFLQGFQPWKK